MGNNIINKLQKSFVSEAINSPLLLSDLASMEKYISESYQGRSLIELLQNADDAIATKFIIKKISEKVYVVANNGRRFSDDDVISICRSGASTKKRKSSTIGFRGIGFKSVVNYAKSVYLTSGEIKLVFSKELTSTLLNNNSNVPLIRIPHELRDVKYAEEIVELEKYGYTTIFVFEINSDELSIEMNEFDPTSMLFLQNIMEVDFFTDSFSENYRIIRDKLFDNKFFSKIVAHNKNSYWLVYEGKNKSSIAFQTDENSVGIKIDSDAAVIHSFMPTKDASGLPLKINGDFSTDPSRTKVVIDEETLTAVENSIEIITDIIINIIVSGRDENLIVQQMESYSKEESILAFMNKKIGSLIINGFQEAFLKKLKIKLRLINNSDVTLYVQPSWLENDDFSKICHKNELFGFGKMQETEIPNLVSFLKKMGVNEMPIELVLSDSVSLEYSLVSRAKIFAESIKKYRFGFSDNNKKIMLNAKILEFENGVLPVLKVKTNDKLNSDFFSMLVDLIADEKDLLWMLKKLNLFDDATGNFPIGDNAIMCNNDNNFTGVSSSIKAKSIISMDSHIKNPTTKDELIQTVIFKEKPIYQKWRSAEENVAILFGSMENVVKVTDVSKSNLGYDLEIQWKDDITYLEIKSVGKLGDSFSLTNNEYATAVEYAGKYALAIVEQSTELLTMCLVYEPIVNLDLFKRVTRWEWVCNEYSGKVISSKIN